MLAHGIPDNVQGSLPASLSLVEEINHRVINEYAEAIAMLSIAAARADQGAHDTLRGVADRLRDYAEAHRTLLAPAIEGLVNLADRIGTICSAYARATLADRNIHLILKADDIWIPADRGWRIGLIVAELVRNAMRHGLKGKTGLIDVRITHENDGVLCLVSDSGRSETSGEPGRGRRLVHSLVSELGGAVRWSFTPRGNFAVAHFPVSDARPVLRAAGAPMARDAIAAK